MRAQYNTHAGNVRLVGGAVGLDFVNTVNSMLVAQPKEYLETYADLLTWSVHAQACTSAEAAQLHQLAAAQPAAAHACLERGWRVRASLFRLLTSAPQAEDVRCLNTELQTTPNRQQLAISADQLVWAAAQPLRLDRPLWSVVWSAADILTSAQHQQVRQCAGAGCSWLFLDTTGGRRHWCSMQDCGNRAKAQRHYQRLRATD